MSTAGNVGETFSLTEAVATNTGNITQLHQLLTAEILALLPTDSPTSITITADTSNVDIDLTNIVNQAAGNVAVNVVRNQAVDYTNIKQICVLNNSVSNTLDIKGSVANDFLGLAAGVLIPIPPNGKVVFEFVTQKAIAGAKNLRITGSGVGTVGKILLLGN